LHGYYFFLQSRMSGYLSQAISDDQEQNTNPNEMN
jgi:hypothetical protein